MVLYKDVYICLWVKVNGTEYQPSIASNNKKLAKSQADTHVSTDIRAGAKGCAYMKLLSELSFI